MRFELIGKTKAKIIAVHPQTKKLGQKDLQAAVKIRVRVMVTNTALEMIYPGLRQFFYESSNQAATEQKTIDGLQVVTDMPQLKPIGTMVPAMRFDKLEQTGSKVKLDYGRGGDADIVLNHADLSKFKAAFNDGGMTPIEFDAFSTDVDHDTFGKLCTLINHDTEIEVIAPEITQQDIEDEDDEPEDTRQTPLQGLAAALGQTAEAEA